MIEFKSEAAVTVPATGDTTIATIKNISGDKLLCFHFDVATQALDNFDVFAKAHPSGALQDLTPANWASLTAGTRIRHASGDLAAVAAAGNGYFEMDIEGLAEIQIKASAAANNASVTPLWSVSS